MNYLDSKTADLWKEDMTILDKAKEAVEGGRQEDYGHPKDNHGLTAKLWSAYLKLPVALTPEQVCMMNILQKISRGTNRLTEDTLVDIAGYARNVEMIRDQE